MALRYKYRRELIKDERSGKSDVVYYPKIPVRLSCKGPPIDVAGLVDSGSTSIFIPLDLAEALELELSEDMETAESWIGKFETKGAKINIIVDNGSQQEILKCVPAVVPVEKGENQEVILGRTFFRYFDITFRENEKITELKRVWPK